MDEQRPLRLASTTESCEGCEPTSTATSRFSPTPSGGTSSYESMLNWSRANGIGFSQFCVWGGDYHSVVSLYESLGFPQIISNLQAYYPAITIASSPGVSAQGSNGLDLFVQGTDNAPRYTHWNGATWSAWTSLGRVLTSSPAATSLGNGTIDVFVRAPTAPSGGSPITMARGDP